ncbi:MAG: branched-chain amino acid ABC transporter permease [Hyphomicrobiales bacterium]|nr:branched-chain amino acid ABC transporter permease [Hyphomicrobiales bacterium]
MLNDILRNARTLSWGWRLGLVAALVFSLLYAQTGSPYYQSFFMSLAMYIVLCTSWNLISGFAGYVSFGHVAFWGLGAYVTAILITKLAFPWPLALLGAGVFTAAFAALISHPLLRLSGVYFAIAMLAMAEAVKVVISYFRSVTGGGGGIYLRPLIGVEDAFLMMSLLALVAVTLMVLTLKTRFIQSLLAIRNNETASSSLGIPTERTKAAALVLSAFFPAIAGGIYILNTAFIDPKTAFDISITINVILMTVFGGIGTVFGAVIGPIAFMILSETLWANFPFVHKAILGAIIILLVLFLPTGIVPTIRRLFNSRKPAASVG